MRADEYHCSAESKSRNMITNLTTGGRLTLILCFVWSAGWIPLLYDLYDGPIRQIFMGIGLLPLIVLSFPLGWLSPGFTSMGHTITQDELVCYLVLSGMNFFLLGYGLTGLWRLIRRLLSPFPAIDSDPYSRSMDSVITDAEQAVRCNRRLRPSLNSGSPPPVHPL
jgi:hypothetical protein